MLKGKPSSSTASPLAPPNKSAKLDVIEKKPINKGLFDDLSNFFVGIRILYFSSPIENEAGFDTSIFHCR